MSWKKIVLTAFGGTDGLEVQTVETPPEPGAAEVRVRVLVTSAAFTDVMIRKGMYPDVKETPPFTPGYDLVGVVDAVGTGVTRFRPGDRVADLTTIGAYAEYICLPEERLTPVPEGVSEVDALGMILSAVTPWQMLTRVAKAKAGQSLLIHGAGGAVGTAMLQLARDAGIAAFGTDVAAKHDLIRSLGGDPHRRGCPRGRAAGGDARRRRLRLRSARRRKPVALAPRAEARRNAHRLRVPERGSGTGRVDPARLREAQALGLAAERPRHGLLFDRGDAAEAPGLVPRRSRGSVRHAGRRADQVRGRRGTPADGGSAST
jgi:hypothetical protein